MGSIIGACPGRFDEFAPILASFLDLEERRFYPDVLWAMGLIAPFAGQRMAYAVPRLQSFLRSPEPSLRGLAAWVLNRMDGLTQPLEMADDSEQFAFFDGKIIREVTVAAMARNAVAIEAASSSI